MAGTTVRHHLSPVTMLSPDMDDAFRKRDAPATATSFPGDALKSGYAKRDVSHYAMPSPVTETVWVDNSGKFWDVPVLTGAGAASSLSAIFSIASQEAQVATGIQKEWWGTDS